MIHICTFCVTIIFIPTKKYRQDKRVERYQHHHPHHNHTLTVQYFTYHRMGSTISHARRNDDDGFEVDVLVD